MLKPKRLGWGVFEVWSKVGKRCYLYKRLSFFVHLLWSETKLFFIDGPMTPLVNFIDWMGSR